jgi:hypothetical protein
VRAGHRDQTGRGLTIGGKESQDGKEGRAFRTCGSPATGCWEAGFALGQGYEVEVQAGRLTIQAV